MSKILPSRSREIKKKNAEPTKKHADLLREELEMKIELSKLITRRRKIVQRIDVITEQCRINRAILADVCKDVDALGLDAARISQVIAVFEKIETVLRQESAKI